MTKYHHILFSPIALIFLALLSFSCNNPATGDHKGRLYNSPNTIPNPQPTTHNPETHAMETHAMETHAMETHAMETHAMRLYRVFIESSTPHYVMNPSKDMLFGQVDLAASDDFMLIDSRYANREGMYMLREAYEAFLEMHAAAASDGISLTIISALRTFDHQKRIWENKWNGRQVLHGNIRATSIADPKERALEILRFSAMPGTSRHHWGTDIDINSLNNSYFDSGQGKREYDWLVANAGRFGFCQPYTEHGTGRVGGYEEEKWHWSYVPVSSQYLQAYMDTISYDDIKGFEGWETARQIGVIERYVMDVGKGCRDARRASPR